jgi:hypothetical protein
VNQPLNHAQDHFETLSLQGLARLAYEIWVQTTEPTNQTPWAEIGEEWQAGWYAVVTAIQDGTFCVDCLRILYDVPWNEMRIEVQGEVPDANRVIVVRDLVAVRQAMRSNIGGRFAFRTADGWTVGLWAMRAAGGRPRCEVHGRAYDDCIRTGGTWQS